MKNPVAYPYIGRRSRRIGIYLSATALMLGVAGTVSCSDDKEPLPILKEKTYTGVKELSVTYCGADMPDKSITFTPVTETDARLTLFSTFDLAQLQLPGIDGVLPAPGMLPGDVRTELPVKLIPSDGAYTFSGTAEGGAVKYTYAGRITATGMEFNVKDAELTGTTLAGGAWTPVPLVKNDSGIGYKSMPFHIKWDVEPIEELDTPLEEILRIAVTVPCIPVYHNTAYSSVAQLLGQAFKTLAFLNNGGTVVTYINTVGGAAHLATSNPTTVQYSVPAPGYVKLYVNPLSVAGLVMTATSGSDITSGLDPESPLIPMLRQLVAALAPQIASGIPMAYTLTDSTFDLYFDTQTAMTVFNQVIAPMLQDPQAKQLIAAELAKYPELASRLPEINDAIDRLPELIAASLNFEFGLSFLKYNPA